MKKLLAALVVAISAGGSPLAQAQSCGSGGGATVCLTASGTADNVQLSWTTAAGSYNSGSATATRGSSCAPTAVTPYTNIGGTWTQTASATVNAGSSAILGPQPVSGGSWSWSGCGASGSSREQTITPKASCQVTAVYTNSCGAKTSQVFTITVPGTMRDITSAQLSQLMSPGWNIGNTLEAIGGETAWGNPKINQQLLNGIKAAGFKSVRIPAAWKQYSDANDNISAAWMARVTEVVDYARNAGLIVMLNVHWDGGWMQPTYAQQAAANARLKKFWTQIANNFKNYDDTLLFAGTNEVMVDGDYGTPTVEYQNVQNGFNQVFVDAVRATGGNNALRHLVVQTFNTNIDHGYNYFTKPNDTVANKMFVEIHYYDPFNFTINGDSNQWQWGASATDPKRETWADEPYVDAAFQKMKTRFIDQGLPVIMGEYGAYLKPAYPGMAPYRRTWAQYVTRSAWQRGLVPMWWDTGEIIDRNTGKVKLQDMVDILVNSAK